MNKKIDLRFGLIALMIFVAAITRLMPHPPNFTPIGGMALFGAAYFTKKYWAFIIPIVALWFSDLIINNVIYPIAFPQYYEGFTLLTTGWISIYGAFALIAVFGLFALKRINLPTVIGSSLVASTLFFLVTNVGVWMSTIAYPKTIEGLIACLGAGVPFFWNTLAGDLFYVALLFGSFEYIKSRYPKLSAA